MDLKGQFSLFYWFQYQKHLCYFSLFWERLQLKQTVYYEQEVGGGIICYHCDSFWRDLVGSRRFLIVNGRIYAIKFIICEGGYLPLSIFQLSLASGKSFVVIWIFFSVFSSSSSHILWLLSMSLISPQSSFKSYRLFSPSHCNNPFQ